jgi:hypothetical protein
MLQAWNSFLYTTLLYTTTYTTTNNTDIHLFNKIKESGISARALELSFPLIITSKHFGKETEIIRILKGIMEEKREDEIFESKDVQLFDFVSRKDELKDEYKSVSELTTEYRIFLAQDNDEEMRWLNSKWMGRALKRLALITQKRRVGHGMDVMLNIEKAKDRVNMFRIEVPKEKPKEKENAV